MFASNQTEMSLKMMKKDHMGMKVLCLEQNDSNYEIFAGDGNISKNGQVEDLIREKIYIESIHWVSKGDLCVNQLRSKFKQLNG